MKTINIGRSKLIVSVEPVAARSRVGRVSKYPLTVAWVGRLTLIRIAR